ncbi:MAG TPA: triphosphoribosyl-dephospho-CoA synthase [Xanthobacteraceae bacterium]
MTASAADVALAFKAACGDELEAPKPGNVHVFASGHRMTAAEFIRSAEAAAGPLALPGARVGSRILGAVEATLAAVGTNTNLGIILLCAPLAAAADASSAGLRAALADVLDSLDLQDGELAFRAIARAAPAGLGKAARHDVSEPATVTLKAAMAEASHRDRIARQYTCAFADVFERGEPALTAALARFADRRWATLAVYLEFLHAFPDSHILRKHGTTTAEAIAGAARDFHARLQSSQDPAALLPDLMQWDAWLKARDINPGTSADLTVATLFAHRLRTILPAARNSD